MLYWQNIYFVLIPIIGRLDFKIKIVVRNLPPVYIAVFIRFTGRTPEFYIDPNLDIRYFKI